MNPFIYIATVCCASAGIVFWQQASINEVQQNIARLSQDLLTMRQKIESDRASLSEFQGKPDRLRGGAKPRPSEGAATALQTLTPANEGWWPTNQPYFYLPKSCLPRMRFGRVRLPVAEVNALMTKRAVAANPNVVSVSVTPDKDGTSTFTYKLFEGGKLNDDMIALLGMSEEESMSVNTLYSGLERAVRNLQAAHIQRVDPPQRDGPDQTSRLIVARIPDLSNEVNPMLTACAEELERVLGAERARILTKQASIHFSEEPDQMSLAAVEFTRNGSELDLWCYKKPGTRTIRQWSTRFFIPQTQDVPYGHLFGPGAPLGGTH